MEQVHTHEAPSHPPNLHELGTTLYERLGGHDEIKAIVDDVMDNHLHDPVVAPRFVHIDDQPKARRLATEFFCAGTGGKEVYTGRDMVEAHTGMNISEHEFVAVVDDILAALVKHGIPPEVRVEVLGILYSMKNDIVHR